MDRPSNPRRASTLPRAVGMATPGAPAPPSAPRPATALRVRAAAPGDVADRRRAFAARVFIAMPSPTPPPAATSLLRLLFAPTPDDSIVVDAGCSAAQEGAEALVGSAETCEEDRRGGDVCSAGDNKVERRARQTSGSHQQRGCARLLRCPSSSPVSGRESRMPARTGSRARLDVSVTCSNRMHTADRNKGVIWIAEGGRGVGRNAAVDARFTGKDVQKR